MMNKKLGSRELLLVSALSFFVGNFFSGGSVIESGINLVGFITLLLGVANILSEKKAEVAISSKTI